MDLTKINPNDLTLMGFLVLLLIFFITQVWPVIRDKWIPAQIEMQQTRLKHDYELAKENNAILSGVKETLAKMTAQLDLLLDGSKLNDRQKQ